MSGDQVTFVGGAMAAVVRAVGEVHVLLGQAPVVVGGLAVLCRLTTPYPATTDLDIVDRRSAGTPQLEVLRRASGAEDVEPAAVLLPTPFGEVRIDVLEVRQIELDRPSDDPGDRLHASAHAWAADTATPMTIRVRIPGTSLVEVTAPVAEPGALVAMKLQAVMDRGIAKQGTDLQDIVRLVLDPEIRDPLLDQIVARDPQTVADVAHHVEHWLVRCRTQTLRRIVDTGGADLTLDDIDLTAELLRAACSEASRDPAAGPST